jgi:hypothetical protein
MPFGLDLKSLIVGAVLAMYVIPYLMSLVNRPKSTAAPAV